MSATDAMVILQERMVNLVNQLSMPVIETSLVIGRWTNKASHHLSMVAQENGETLPPLLAEAWPLEIETLESDVEFDLESRELFMFRARMSYWADRRKRDIRGIRENECPTWFVWCALQRAACTMV